MSIFESARTIVRGREAKSVENEVKFGIFMVTKSNSERKSVYSLSSSVLDDDKSYRLKCSMVFVST